MLEPNRMRYLVAYRETPTSTWRRGGDHDSYSLALVEAEERGLPECLAYVTAAWGTEDSMNTAIARLNHPAPELLGVVSLPLPINTTIFADWWRKLDHYLAMLDEKPSTLGEARDYFVGEDAPSLAAIKLRALRMRVRKLEARA